MLVAGTWQVEMHTWAMLSGGPGSGIYMTRDGGAKWTRVAQPGMPRSPVGKIDVAIAPSDSKRMYALIQTADQGSLWRSDDGGTTWKVVSWDRVAHRPRRLLHPARGQPAECRRVLVAEQQLPSIDGRRRDVPAVAAAAATATTSGSIPKNADAFVLTDDGGADHDHHGQGRRAIRLPNGQMYHVAIDNRVPYWIYSKRRTTGRCAARARAGDRLAEQRRACRRPAAAVVAAVAGAAVAAAPGRRGITSIGGCESGFTMPDPADPDIVWALVLRQQADAVGRATGDRALGLAVDDHVRFAADHVEVPLPLDGAARARSVRAQHRVLRMPGDLQDDERRPELERDQPGSLDPGSLAASFRPAASSATTSASSPASSCSRLRRRRCRRG